MNSDTKIRDFRVMNEERELRFRGMLLGFSSTENRGSDRWIEFSLYRTAESGKYVLHRVGRSVRFHDQYCVVVAKNPTLRPVALATLSEDASPCPECLPQGDHHLDDNHQVYPERDRNWAGAYETPKDLIDGLSKEDRQGIKSLTAPARGLLENAAKNDQEISDAYYIVEIS